MNYHLPGEMDVMWQVIVQVGESDFVLCPDGLSDDDFVDVVELIPVFIPVGETKKDQLKHKSSCIYSSLMFCLE